MKLSEAWLREYVNPSVDSTELQNQLSLAGLEVDAVELVAADFTHVVVGKVVTKAKHPDADKLSVCQVDVGQAEPLQIVCGAKNVAADMKVPVATIGAVLPGDFKIKKSKLRGVESQGMICSASELGLAESSDGILPLPADAPIGKNFRDYWQLDDVSIDIDLTPNRADCLSVVGIAREVGVINQCKVKFPKITAVKTTIKAQQPAKVMASAACPRYLTRVLTGIDNKAVTPWHIVEKLRRSGIRSISPVVDITNYVMLLLGQPLHAFDRDTLQGDITVRLAKPKEQMTLLDGQAIHLREDTLLIADQAGPLAMAGVMGGEHSGVSEGTHAIVLESAFFAPEHIAGRARQYGLHTDASHRFERGVDPDITQNAMELATQLLLDVVGGAAGPIFEVVDKKQLPKRQKVTLHIDRVEALLGVAIPATQIKSVLQHLGLTLQSEQTDKQIWEIPPFRFDIALEADLIEEIARVIGYDAIPSTLPTLPLATFPVSEKKVAISALKQSLLQQGFHEAITYSFIDPQQQQHFDNGLKPLQLKNPIAADMAIMRTSLVPGLLNAAAYNIKRQQNRVRMFEIGRCYLPAGKQVAEPLRVAGVMFGSEYPEHWQGNNRPVDFFNVKGIVSQLIAPTGELPQCRFEPLTDCPWLHPGQAAKVMLGKQQLGVVGALHPALWKPFGLKQAVMVFELDYAILSKRQLPRYQAISKFPSIRRDIAIEVDTTLSAQRVIDVIVQAGGDRLQYCEVFDVYQGEGVGAGKKSLAIALIFQALSHTLTETEVNTVMDSIIERLTNSIQAQLRE